MSKKNKKALKISEQEVNQEVITKPKLDKFQEMKKDILKMEKISKQINEINKIINTNKIKLDKLLEQEKIFKSKYNL